MLKKIFTQILPKKDSIEPKAKEAKENKAEKLKEFFKGRVDALKEEFETIKYKCQDLRKTNYDLAMMHREKGDVKEAAFRFWLMTKFWPEYYEAYYEMAYCLYLNNKKFKAKKVLENLLDKKTPYSKKAKALLKDLDSNI